MEYIIAGIQNRNRSRNETDFIDVIASEIPSVLVKKMNDVVNLPVSVRHITNDELYGTWSVFFIDKRINIPTVLYKVMPITIIIVLKMRMNIFGGFFIENLSVLCLLASF
eukprot:779400_1